MEFAQTLRIIRRRLQIIAFVTFVVGSLTFILRVSQPPLYRAQVTLAIGNFIQLPNPELQEIRTGLDLAQTYAQLIRTRGVLLGIIENLDLDMDIRALGQMLDTRLVTGTSFLQVGVTYNDPLLAMAIANELAQQLILQSPTNLNATQQQIDLLDDQITTLSVELEQLRAELHQVDLSVLNVSSEDANALNEQRNFLVGQINQSTANIAQFSETMASLQQRSNSVEVVESAEFPEEAAGISPVIMALLASMVAILIATGIVLLYEYLNETFYTADEAVQQLELPILGVISTFGMPNDTYSERMLMNISPFSQTMQEYSTLRTNLYFSTGGQKRVFVVCSASPKEGKSVTATNLAVSIAIAGLRVLLVDADLRRPRVHEAFQLPNGTGFSGLIQYSAQPHEALPAPVNGSDDGLLTDQILRQFVQKTDLPGLYVLPSGFAPHNPSELIGFAATKNWIEYFQQSPHLDVVIFDTPPVLAVPDAAILAATAKAKVLLVVQANATRRTEALKAKQRFEQINVEIAGVILNNVDRQGETYYGYNYEAYYTETSTVDKT